MRIGILINCDKSIGGTYHYYVSLLNAFRDYDNEHNYYIFYTDANFPIKEYNKNSFNFIPYNQNKKFIGIRVYNRIKKYINFAFASLRIDVFLKYKNPEYEKLQKYKLDILLTAAPTIDAFCAKIPFICIIHDLWFLDNKKIPGAKTILGEILRKKHAEILAKNATKVIVESNLLKKQVMQFYYIKEENIYILPTGPADFVWNYNKNRLEKVKTKYNLPQHYIFYPANFSGFKNHERILQAIRILKSDYNLSINVVLSGPSNNVETLKSKIDRNNVKDLVRVFGYLPNEDMPLFYKGALCLCMASYLGPTNMPIWEALAIGCPVIAAHIGDQAWQVGNAGLLFNPDDGKQLAHHIYQVYSNKELREKLIENGYEIAKIIQPKVRAKILTDVLKGIK